MRYYFLDSSALVKRYRDESGSENVNSMFEDPNFVLVVSRLGTVELQSSIMQHIRLGSITLADAELLKHAVLQDIRDDRLKITPVISNHFRLAGQLVIRHGHCHRLRTLDALQLGVAVDLKQRHGIEAFVAADKSLLAVSQLEGFNTINPTEDCATVA